jgi:hypothetical protein
MKPLKTTPSSRTFPSSRRNGKRILTYNWSTRVKSLHPTPSAPSSLTNVQQLYEEKAAEPANVIQEALGPYVVKGQSLSRLDLERALTEHL